MSSTYNRFYHNKNAKHSKSARSYRFFLFETLAEKKTIFDSIKPIELTKPVESMEPVESSHHVKFVKFVELVDLLEQIFKNFKNL